MNTLDKVIKSCDIAEHVLTYTDENGKRIKETFLGQPGILYRRKEVLKEQGCTNIRIKRGD